MEKSKIDEAIEITCKVIDENIELLADIDRGLLSQNILSQLRNLIEYIIQKISNENANPNNYTEKSSCIHSLKNTQEFKTNKKIQAIQKFHDRLQMSVSHYTLNKDSSERLMLSYYNKLLIVKEYLYEKYNMTVLKNLDKFPLYLDHNLLDYYNKIAKTIESPSEYASTDNFNERVYIHKIKPFIVNGKNYYEVTFNIANDKISKFDRIIAFTTLEINDYYAVKLTLHNDYIEIMGQIISIKIIDSWQTSIRPCELNHISEILGLNYTFLTSDKDYYNLMNFLTSTNMNLVDILICADEEYEDIKNLCAVDTIHSKIFQVLTRAREIIKDNKPGSNILRYLFYHLNNKVLKSQKSNENCNLLSDLYLKYGCNPFDNIPFATSLIKHNPYFDDLLECLDTTSRQHEFLARQIHNHTEQEGILFTSVDDLSEYNNIDELIEKFNSKIYKPKHEMRQLKKYNNVLYIEEHAFETSEIIKKLKELSSNGVEHYTEYVNEWLNQKSDNEEISEDKSEALKRMFTYSHVALIYGSAGTGKTKLIEHISNMFDDKNKLYLANTNAAVSNLKRRINSNNCYFSTIDKYNFTKGRGKYDIVFIDECSTVANKDMKKFLDDTDFEILVLVGDLFQIESIQFGNWFGLARNFVHTRAITELIYPFRVSKDNTLLLAFWDRVRILEESLLEPDAKANYSVELDDTVFERIDKDEIILCLNYNGFYGINNINRLMQCNNANKSVIWGLSTYKVDDPVLFNETKRFSPLIYNNMKGRIVDFQVEEYRIRFDIEIDEKIEESDTLNYDLELIETTEEKSIIRFYVDKFKSTDDDNDDDNKSVVPFQVSYAVSIHKAQGLEYDSVKIIITEEVEEQISHNIFYTAITRTKEHLKIYWPPEIENRFLKRLLSEKFCNYNQDAEILSNIYGLSITLKTFDFLRREKSLMEKRDSQKRKSKSKPKL